MRGLCRCLLSVVFADSSRFPEAKHVLIVSKRRACVMDLSCSRPSPPRRSSLAYFCAERCEAWNGDRRAAVVEKEILVCCPVLLLRACAVDGLFPVRCSSSRLNSCARESVSTRRTITVMRIKCQCILRILLNHCDGNEI